MSCIKQTPKLASPKYGNMVWVNNRKLDLKKSASEIRCKTYITLGLVQNIYRKPPTQNMNDLDTAALKYMRPN